MGSWKFYYWTILRSEQERFTSLGKSENLGRLLDSIASFPVWNDVQLFLFCTTPCVADAFRWERALASATFPETSGVALILGVFRWKSICAREELDESFPPDKRGVVKKIGKINDERIISYSVNFFPLTLSKVDGVEYRRKSFFKIKGAHLQSLLIVLHHMYCKYICMYICTNKRKK